MAARRKPAVRVPSSKLVRKIDAVNAVIAARIKGATLPEAAAAAGLTVREAGAALEDYLALEENRAVRAAAELREIEARRLDELHRILWPEVEAPDPETGNRMRAAEVVLRVMERRARLLGLDMPAQVHVSSAIEQAVPPETLAALAQEYLASLAVVPAAAPDAHDAAGGSADGA